MNKRIVRRNKVEDNFLPDSIHPVIKQVYASRGLKADEELNLTVSQLEQIDLMKGIQQACEVLHAALIHNKTIVVIGDFDADGATSTALMMEALTMFGSRRHSFLVPNRFEYGYGLSPEIVEIAAQNGAEVLVTVDNGISCIAGVEKAKSLGLKVVITDHHLPGKVTPDADAIVNPNQKGCPFKSKSIAGVGVAFYFMLALRKHLREQGWFSQNQIAEPNIASLLDLVALGTVADVVSLDYNNRILVEQGLKRIRAGATRPGIQALIEISNKNQQQLTASDFGFGLGPRINAAGRLDDMSFGIQCLLAKEINEARAMAQELDALNKSRREIEQGMQQEAEHIMSALNYTEASLPHALALYQRDWHQGVIGIVAGRLKEKFHRPAIVFANGDDSGMEIKGSARSIPGLHIRDLLEFIGSQHPGLILKFGGHAMAAGLSIKTEDFDRFQQIFNETAQQWLKPEDLEGTLLSDGALEASDISLDFAQTLQRAGPWGQNFEEPLFDDVFTLVQQRIVGEKHLKLVVSKGDAVIDAIAFNVDTKLWPNYQSDKVKLAYRLDINEFRGNRSVQLIVAHIETF